MENNLSHAVYASQPHISRGRVVDEPETKGRSPFQRDRDRIIHCSAFRRLKSKTQVFVYHEGESYRTRLTHSIEVSQIARAICRHLALNADLSEALALAHDLGHAPFGHAGEFVLQDCMKDYGGFDHNAQSLRVVTKLERRYAAFDGLNLTWETLEGLVKHNGPLTGLPDSKPLPSYIAEYNRSHNLELGTWPSAEAQVAAMADDIAYNNHDLDDGYHAGLFTLGELRDVPLVGPMIREVEALYPGLDGSRIIHETVRRLIHAMIYDLVDESRRRLAEVNPQSAGEVRTAGFPLVSFSQEMKNNDTALKEFLFPHMYRHYKVNRMTSKARRIVRDMFMLLNAEPKLLPDPWRAMTGDTPRTQQTARIVCDYIAGMTDIFAIEEHTRLFDPKVRP